MRGGDSTVPSPKSSGTKSPSCLPWVGRGGQPLILRQGPWGGARRLLEPLAQHVTHPLPFARPCCRWCEALVAKTKQDPKEGGGHGPGYTWTQTASEVTISFKVCVDCWDAEGKGQGAGVLNACWRGQGAGVSVSLPPSCVLWLLTPDCPGQCHCLRCRFMAAHHTLTAGAACSCTRTAPSGTSSCC